MTEQLEQQNKKQVFLEINTINLDDDLESYNLKDAIVGKVYALRVIKREINRICFDLVELP